MIELFLKCLLIDTIIVFLFIKFSWPSAYLDYKGVNYIFNYREIKNVKIWFIDDMNLIGIILMFTLFTFGFFFIIRII